MARELNKLTAALVAGANRRGYLADGGGLYLQISKTGAKSWVFRFRDGGKLKEMGLGSTHTVTLDGARDLAAQCRLQRLGGVDPLKARNDFRRRAAPAGLDSTAASASSGQNATVDGDPVSAYLDLFYPIHYMVGIKIEDTLRSNILSRQQTCILWMIRMQGVDGCEMRRKDIERALTGWFEISSSTISKALQSLSKQLDLVTITEDPVSAREKIVRLTPRGERFLADMVKNGKSLMKWMIERLDGSEVISGVHFLSRVSEIFETFPGVDEILTLDSQRSG